MTVFRSKAFHFDATPDEAREAVSRVLDENRRYVLRSAGDNSWVFVHRPRGFPLVLETDMTAVLQWNDSPGVTIPATTKSQPFLFGDVLNVYNTYLDNLAVEINDSLASTAKS